MTFPRPVLLLLLPLLSCSSNTPAGPVGTGATAMAMIGSAGGMVMHPEGAALMVPPGALASDQMISITALTTGPSSFSSWSSPVYKFGPDGLTFNQPVTATLNFTGTPQDPTIFLTAPGGGSYEDIGGSVNGTSISTQVIHFSECIVAPRRAYNPGAGCTALVNGAPQVYQTYNPTDAPPPQGGPLVAGTYLLTEHIRYTGPGGQSGTDTTSWRRQTVRITNVAGSTANIEMIEIRPDREQRQSGTLTVSGVNLTFTATCPAGSNNNNDMNQYTSAGNTFLVYEPASQNGQTDGGTGSNEIKVMVFTRQ